jgi:GNAT superfamily N-acetyltransferase
VDFSIRQASAHDSAVISNVLKEAAEWLTERGMPMWRAGELEPADIAKAVEAGEFYVLECGGEVAGTVKFQLEDPLFWPDVPGGESAFIHRVAVRRAFAGSGASGAMMQWAAERARALGKRYVRLDCEAARPSLRAVYERFGFRYHSDRQVGPYLVARYEFPLF